MLTDTQEATNVISRRYQVLEKIGAGGMGVVYRAVDRLTGERIALKQVTVPAKELLFASSGASMDFRLSLAQEFKTLASLRHPNIISVLDYGFDTLKQPYYTMDLLENPQTIIEAGRTMQVGDKVTLIVELLRALAYLHRRGIVHRDLKPANVMVVNGQVKVLDFGLSVKRDQLETHDKSDNIVGTLAYMAPEILRGAPHSEASDMFAVGVIGYELFVGQHPFEVGDITKLIYEIAEKQIRVEDMDVDERIGTVLARLLSKRPEDRYQDVMEIITYYASVSERQLPYETSATRESFLQAAHFVGRDSELTQLTDALYQIVDSKTGHISGSAWLVGGESGVGKSRLLDELRSVALVEGALVLRGQSISEGGAQYQVWRDTLRWLTLITDLTDFEASVLKVIIPDITTLLGRPVADAPELEPQAMQDRLLNVIEALFRKQTQPLMVILEDLHWAGSESLAVMTRLNDMISRLPLLVIGSYRDDEKPNLPKLLSGMNVLKLNRLSDESISELSVSMLGAVGQQAQVVQFIQRETEGNVFFMIEVVRTLAEEAGRLDQIGHITLPERIFAGGMQRVIQRRLTRVPEAAYPLLQAAAVAGRQLDLNILRTIAGSDFNLEDWLIAVSDAAVLDVLDGYWRFAHDKLREGLLAELSPDTARQLHRQVAEAIERVYPDTTQQSAALAFHWGQVGDAEKEAHYTSVAGEQALLSGASHEAVSLLKRALELYQQVPIMPKERGLIERRLADAYLGIGQLPLCREHLAKALDLMGYGIPKNRVSLILSMMRQNMTQTAHRLLPGRMLGRDAQNRNLLLEATQGYERIGQMHYLANEPIDAFYSSVRGLNLGEKAGDRSGELARIYANMGISYGFIPIHPIARFYNKKALETGRSVDDPLALAWALEVVGIYHAGIGEWQPAIPYVEESVEITKRLGDGRHWNESLAILTYVHYCHGKLHASTARPDEMYASAVKRGDVQMQGNAMHGLSLNLLRLGRVEETITAVEKLENICLAVNDLPVSISCYGIMARAYHYHGDADRAEKAVESAMNLIKKLLLPNAFYSFEGYNGPVETYLGLWEQTGDIRYQKAAKKALGNLSGYARVFTIGQPRLNLWKGVYEWLSGNHDKARAAWEKSLRAAEKFDLDYEAALTRLHMGRLDTQNPQSREHLMRGGETFQNQGAAYDLSRVEQALA